MLVPLKGHEKSKFGGFNDEAPTNHPIERLDITVLENNFEKWFREEDSLQAFLNPKVAKQRFQDFKTKVEVWKSREKQRARVKKSYKKHTQKLRSTLIEKAKRFTIDNELVHQCMTIFDGLQEDLSKLSKEEKILNDFLVQVPENFIVLEVRELDSIAEKFEKVFKDNFQILQDFVQHVKQDCVMDKFFFNFFDIPDLIIKMKYTRNQYDMIVKVLLKVKNSYLEAKMEKEIMVKMQENLLKMSGRGQYDQDENDGGQGFGGFKGKKGEDQEQKIADMQVTDEDFVPLELFDGVLAEFQHKFFTKRHVQLEFIKLCREEAIKK